MDASKGLTPLEEEMRAAAAAGDLVDRGEGPFSPAEMRAWGEDRTVRAEVLRFLLVEYESVAAKGVRLRGIKIKGHLDLAAAKVQCPLRLDSCCLDGPRPDLSFATISLLELKHCHLAGLAAESLIVSKDLDLSGSTFTRPIDLMAADIAGWLTCTGAQLNGTDEARNALVAFGIKVGGCAYFDEGFAAVGGVSLLGADITGMLKLSGALLSADRDGDALVADWIKVGGAADLKGTVTSTGAIRLACADITGPLYLRGAQLNGKDKEDNALVAFRVKVGSDVFLDEGFTSYGAVRLTGADITGTLTLRSAKLNGKDRENNALVADSLNVGGRVIIDDGFIAAGTVRLPGANIIGRIRCGDAKFKGKDKYGRALLADGMRVGGGMWLGGVRTKCGAIRLVGADITGDLRCDGVRLKGTDEHGNAIVADRINVSGSVFLGFSKRSYGLRGSIAEGAVSLKSAHVGGSLRLKPEKLAGGRNAEGQQKVALDLTGAQIAQDLVWEPSQAVLGEVILDDAEVGQLKDNLELNPNGYWPSACDGLLRLDGFTYSRICEASEVTLQKRLEWIGSPHKRAKNKRLVFATQPYEQLATVYRKAGQDTEARKVAIARRRTCADMETSPGTARSATGC